MGENCHVICVCCGQGFPNGMAQTSRIRMVGKALAAEGCRFTVFNIGAGLCPNSASRGAIDGIDFEFLPGPTVRPADRSKRAWMYVLGMLQAGLRLYRLRRKERDLCVYLWFGGGKYPFFLCFLQAIGLPVIQEVNEWWPGEKKRAIRNRYLKHSQGTLAISRPVIERLKALPNYTPAHRILHVPILIDPEELSPHAGADVEQRGAPPYILWCGNIAASDEDIQFLLRVAKVVNEFERCRLLLVGKHSASAGVQVREWARIQKLKDDLVDMPGYVSDGELNRLMSGATALLLPLWETERSICRFPTKLGHYLGSATPVVTTGLGDATFYLEDGKSACLVPPDDAKAFAEKVILLIRDSRRALTIGRAGRHVAIEHFSIQAHKTQLAQFFAEVAN